MEKLTMIKTYNSKAGDCRICRLVQYLVAVGKPFSFDGCIVEFDATESFVNRMCVEDTKLVGLVFER